MTDTKLENQNEDLNTTLPPDDAENADNLNDTRTEIEVLRDRADQLGIKYSGNTGVATLRKKIDDFLATDVATPSTLSEVTGIDDEDDAQEANAPRAETAQEARKRLMQLVRVQVTLLNTNKANRPGETIEVINDVIGKVGKFIPFDPAFYAYGYHVPLCIYNALVNAQYVYVQTTRDVVTGKETKKAVLKPEFNVTVLPNITPKQLQELKDSQIARNALSD